LLRERYPHSRFRLFRADPRMIVRAQSSELIA